MATRYLTVVFAIDDEKEFKPMQDKFHSKMLAPNNEPWRVSSMSLGDEMTKVELLENAVNNLEDKYEIKEVCHQISSTPLQNLEGKTVDDFIERHA